MLRTVLPLALVSMVVACSDTARSGIDDGTSAGASGSPTAITTTDAGDTTPTTSTTESTDAGTTSGHTGTPTDAATADTGTTAVPGTDAGEPATRGQCKRGVAYGNHSEADMAALSPSVSWWYNWTHRPDEGVRDGTFRDLDVEYVPMTWNDAFGVDTLVAEIPEGVTHLLGFNEPNFGWQANLTAQQAADAWPEVEAVADARGLRLVSPAVNYCGGNCNQTNPFAYLNDFFAACTNCRVDAIAIHIDVGCNAQWLIDHVENYKAMFDEPLWLTEFACDSASSLEEQRDFLQAAVAYLENEPRIERYAWFAGRADNVPYVDLLGDDGQLTLLGQAYVDAPHADADCEK